MWASTQDENARLKGEQMSTAEGKRERVIVSGVDMPFWDMVSALTWLFVAMVPASILASLVLSLPAIILFFIVASAGGGSW